MLLCRILSGIVFVVNANHKINPQDMIVWFRDKADEFNRIADTLESTFDSGNGMLKTPPVVGEPHRGFAEIGVEMIKKFISEKGSAQVGTIVEELQTTRESVQKVLDANPDQFKRIGKGWIQVKE